MHTHSLSINSDPGRALRPWELALLLGAVGYRGFVSVEMAHADVDTIRRAMDYNAEVFA